ncbi:MAG TPA: hypothetical protein VKV15_11195 [Bryobacteraceae bacterium]|nr:hypothetical protein [Bryobacteraceae bacterium]
MPAFASAINYNTIDGYQYNVVQTGLYRIARTAQPEGAQLSTPGAQTRRSAAILA